MACNFQNPSLNPRHSPNQKPPVPEKHFNEEKAHTPIKGTKTTNPKGSPKGVKGGGGGAKAKG
eukprot:12927293-Prorocentrum_lima.AAC.1